MNERILKLREQAGLQPYYDAQEAQIERFAELIVRECIDWCNAHATIDGTAQKIVESIKKDFGVE